MAGPCIVSPVSSRQQRTETNVSRATVESDRAIREKQAQQRRTMDKAIRSEVKYD